MQQNQISSCNFNRKRLKEVHAAVYPESSIPIFKLIYFSQDILVPPLQQRKKPVSQITFPCFSKDGLFILPRPLKPSPLKYHPSYSHSVKINCSFLCAPAVCCLYLLQLLFHSVLQFLHSCMQVDPFQRKDILTQPTRSPKSTLGINE